MLALVGGSEEESWMYWSLNMRNVSAFWCSGEVLNRVSPVDRRRTVKLNGVVLWRVNSRSEFGVERVVGEWEVDGGDGGGGRWRISSGTSHRWWLASVIRIRRRSFVSKLAMRIRL